jgi:hypothetical protein
MKGEPHGTSTSRWQPESSKGHARVQDRDAQIFLGAKIRKRKQAVAIALSEARQAGAKIPKKKKAAAKRKKPAAKR